MSKILLYTDCHFSQYSSIIRKRGKKYSQRLENLIQSINWAENLSHNTFCDMVVCLGDFFDKPELNAEEITAMQEIEFDMRVPHYFIVGNHESNVSDLLFSSTKYLGSKNNFKIIDKPLEWNLDSDTNLYFLPYILEEDRKNLSYYLNNDDKKKIVFSHNDIKGIRYGKFESKDGFDLTDIENNCDLFINGHLHNGNFLNDKETILNLGNLTGQNFSEDSYKYSHYACILDTKTLELTFYENPFAFNFYKLDINEEQEFSKLYALKNNAVVTIRCEESLVETLRNTLNSISNIVDYRVISYKKEHSGEQGKIDSTSLNNIDYLEQFTDFILNHIGSDEIVKEELSAIIGG